MATEPKQAATQPSPDDQAAQVAAARELLLSQGAQVFLPQDLHGFKMSLTDPLKATIAERDAELTRVREEAALLGREKTERDNAGKTAAQLLEAQLKAAQADLQRSKAEFDRERAERATERERHKAERRDARLQAVLFDPSVPQAVDAEAALLKAKAKLGALSVTDSGDLRWTEPNGIEHDGPAAEKIVREWWAQQTTLHRGPAAGPPTGGAPRAPTPQPEKYVSDPNEPLDIRLARAREWNARTKVAR